MQSLIRHVGQVGRRPASVAGGAMSAFYQGNFGPGLFEQVRRGDTGQARPNNHRIHFKIACQRSKAGSFVRNSPIRGRFHSLTPAGGLRVDQVWLADARPFDLLAAGGTFLFARRG